MSQPRQPTTRAPNAGTGEILPCRLEATEPFHVMAVLAKARAKEAAGADIIHMEIGEPDFPLPEPIRDAARAALEGRPLGYTQAGGLPALREAIAGDYQTRHGVAIEPARVLVTPGASGALLLALAAVLDPGDAVVVPVPGYPCNPQFVRVLSGRIHRLAVHEQPDLQPTAEQLRRAWPADGRSVILASPANPSGGLLEPPRLAALLSVAHNAGGLGIVDEIYQGLVYPPATSATALALDVPSLVLNSFSKTYAMTGWRLGWLVAPANRVEHLERLAQNLFISAPTLAQYAALAAFDPATEAIVATRRAILARRRDCLVEGLRRLGFGIPVAPQGAFYVYADCRALGWRGTELAEHLLATADLAITPGLDFGGAEAEHFVRFAYTTTQERIEAALARMADALVPD